MTDKTNCLCFLIDSRSDVSVLPRKGIKVIDIQTTYALYAANNSEIKTFGMKTLTLDFGLPEKCIWNFVVADVSTPIIGANLLKACHLLPDLARRLLIDGKTLTSLKCTTKMVQHQSVHMVDLKMYPNKAADHLKNFLVSLNPLNINRILHTMSCTTWILSMKSQSIRNYVDWIPTLKKLFVTNFEKIYNQVSADPLAPVGPRR